MKDYTYEMALSMLPGVGSHSARQILDIVDSAETLFHMSASELRHLFGNHDAIIKAILNRSMFPDVEEELRFVEKNHIEILYYTDAAYPQRMNRSECVDNPILLYRMGNADLNAQRIVSVVGTRRATEYGKEMTRKLIDGFRGEGITVISGLALGIDAAAHEGALANQLPTIGVLAHGLDQLYPPSNRPLAKRMLAQGGGLVTEIKSRTSILPGMFPARNRIIAAMSDATIVVEASRKGGALITANIANGYHRDLFAFPGRVGDKYSEGCNGIIAACKAIMIRDAKDVFFNMSWAQHTKHEGTQATLFPKLQGDEAAVLSIIREHPDISVDQIQSYCDLSLPKIATALLSLELKNCCRCLPGKIYKAL